MSTPIVVARIYVGGPMVKVTMIPRNVNWQEEWPKIVARMSAWRGGATAYLKSFEHLHGYASTQNQHASDPTATMLITEAHQIFERTMELPLPSPLSETVAALKDTLYSLKNATEGARGVASQLIALEILRGPVEEAVISSETPRRALVERAFLHLDRLLVADPEARLRWQNAMKQRKNGELICERLGALHFLQHGIYAFKADAGTGRTDLIFGERVDPTEQVLSAAVLVLTEWKVVREDSDITEIAKEGFNQARRYARIELGGFELKHT